MQKKTGTGIRVLLLVAVVCLVWAGNSQAQEYPKGPVQIVIPFAPGGSTDILWRSISEYMAKNIGGQIALINKAGGGGIVGTSFVVNSKPDGYTLLSANSDPLNIAPLFTPDAPYDAEKDITFIAKLAVFPFAITVRADSPFKTLEDLVAFAKANPRKLKSAVAGVGTTPHMINEMFNRDAKVEITAVPFGGGGECVPALLGGHVDMTVLSIAPVKPQVLAGKVRPLALFSPKRFADFPQIPTVAEKGYKTSNIATGVGLGGPKGLSPAIVKKWEDAVDKTMKDPKVIQVVDKLEGLIIDFKSGEAYRKEVLTDLATFKPIVPTLTGKK
jgi:tripartite-type tricarboxylate transporter receptor subunit TctC